jgi:hypothetical protein
MAVVNGVCWKTCKVQSTCTSSSVHRSRQATIKVSAWPASGYPDPQRRERDKVKLFDSKMVLSTRPEWTRATTGIPIDCVARIKASPAGGREEAHLLQLLLPVSFRSGQLSAAAR